MYPQLFNKAESLSSLNTLGRLVETKLASVFNNNFRVSVEGGYQPGYGEMFSQEISFRCPAEPSSHLTRHYNGELLVRIIASKE